MLLKDYLAEVALSAGANKTSAAVPNNIGLLLTGLIQRLVELCCSNHLPQGRYPMLHSVQAGHAQLLPIADMNMLNATAVLGEFCPQPMLLQ